MQQRCVITLTARQLDDFVRSLGYAPAGKYPFLQEVLKEDGSDQPLHLVAVDPPTVLDGPVGEDRQAFYLVYPEGDEPEGTALDVPVKFTQS